MSAAVCVQHRLKSELQLGGRSERCLRVGTVGKGLEFITWPAAHTDAFALGTAGIIQSLQRMCMASRAPSFDLDGRGRRRGRVGRDLHTSFDVGERSFTRIRMYEASVDFWKML
jgi:hypothetical protein